MKRIFITLAFLCAALPAFAQSPVPPVQVPALSLQRLSFAVGANYDWFSQVNIPPANSEFSVGVYAAYALTAPGDGSKVPALSLIGAATRGFDNKTVKATVGLRVALYNGGK